MLRWRLLLSAVFIAALVGLCWLDLHAERPGIVLLPLAIVAALLAAGELLAMFRKRGHEPLSWVVYGGVLLTVVAAALPGLWPAIAAGSAIQSVGWIAVGLAIGLLVAFAGELNRYDGSGRATLNLSLAIFAMMYVGGLMGFLVQLRLFGGGSGRMGMHALVSMIAIVKMSDIGQYTAGRLFGKHKLAPTLSPGKTWEGVAGGALFACLAAWLAGHAAHHEGVISSEQWIRTIVYALALVAAGIVGDLIESLLKRDAGVKDSSAWMPGFGGVLDLIDSLLGAAPVAYLFWAMGWVGG
jgi:phosphatidate cytidylyltransferase